MNAIIDNPAVLYDTALVATSGTVLRVTVAAYLAATVPAPDNPRREESLVENIARLRAIWDPARAGRYTAFHPLSVRPHVDPVTGEPIPPVKACVLEIARGNTSRVLLEELDQTEWPAFIEVTVTRAETLTERLDAFGDADTVSPIPVRDVPHYVVAILRAHPSNADWSPWNRQTLSVPGDAVELAAQKLAPVLGVAVATPPVPPAPPALGAGARERARYAEEIAAYHQRRESYRKALFTAWNGRLQGPARHFVLAYGQHGHLIRPWLPSFGAPETIGQITDKVTRSLILAYQGQTLKPEHVAAIQRCVDQASPELADALIEWCGYVSPEVELKAPEPDAVESRERERERRRLARNPNKATVREYLVEYFATKKIDAEQVLNQNVPAKAETFGDVIEELDDIVATIKALN